MEAMPFKLLIIAVLLLFTILIGFTALDHASANIQADAAYKTVNAFLIKTEIVASGAPGSRETIDLVLHGNSKLVLYNEDINGTQYGIVKVDMGKKGGYIQVLPVMVAADESPVNFARDITYIAGEYYVSLTHRVNGTTDYIAIG